ncbi:hypothetical protein [Saccharothrix syringae]|uniref:Uncharacterized protein n=1 Tax=Saccharothrix syringae TaxID=103733 RepID=A0A5Q0GXK4_SACSY|nr:hypothetical protein [Saccharothrix syringae]QFZ18613.1 hypothetical protein EKG83_15110 [Saccharothrix syringae]
MAPTSALRRITVPLLTTALIVLGVLGIAGTASAAAAYQLTLCDYSTSLVARATFPQRFVSSTTVGYNQCTSITHYGNEQVVIEVSPKPGSNPVRNTVRSSYTTRLANEVFHVRADGSVFRY